MHMNVQGAAEKHRCSVLDYLIIARLMMLETLEFGEEVIGLLALDHDF